jgi:serine protease AprX
MRSSLSRLALWACVTIAAAGCQSELADDASLVVVGDSIIRESTGKVSDLKTITVEGSAIRIATWKETSHGETSAWYAINLGKGWHEAKRTSYDVPLRARRIDPKQEMASEADTSSSGSNLHIVQYVSQPLEAFWRAIARAGGEVHQYVHGNAQIVRGDARAMARIARLSFVRAVTPMRATDRIAASLAKVSSESALGVDIVLVDAKRDRAIVEDGIRAMGGRVVVSDPDGILVEAEISSKHTLAIAAMPQVLWIDASKPMELDYDIANQQGGATFLQALPPDPLPGLNYTGLGIRGHIMEGINPAHQDFAATEHRTVPVAIDAPESDSHGVQTFGIVFGSGAGNARARGLLPNGQGYYTNNAVLVDGALGGRSALVGRLIAEHKVMFQTASWGNGLATVYGPKSAEMDALILKHDIPITQSQSNTGTQDSRPQAWAKNIISVGALRHFGTVTPDDDKWSGSGSIGPAADGSLKPDLAFYYDKTITTTQSGGYSNNFGGTSGATPTVAGHVGLTIELWTNGVFGNPLLPRGEGEDLASYRFKNRPHFTTTKALLIHSAKQYAFQGDNDDRTRTHQGWGIPDLEGMYRRRTNMLVVNETDVLQNLERKAYTIDVAAGAPDFRATLVYADREATVPATIHRVNNLDLKVTAPDGTVYWGNNGLRASTASTPGGVHNTLDTVENVIVPSPRAGRWTIEVIADELNADTNLATEAVDSRYALVVSTAPTP